jgi:chemotaxis protein histidine kinase CheA
MTVPLLKSLQSKNILWADVMDYEDEMKELFSKESLSLEDFAKCLHNLVERCDIDLTEDKPAFYYKVKDTYIDFVLRDRLIICISQRKKKKNLDHNDPETSSQTSVESEEDTDHTDHEVTDEKKMVEEEVEQKETPNTEDDQSTPRKSDLESLPEKTIPLKNNFELVSKQELEKAALEAFQKQQKPNLVPSTDISVDDTLTSNKFENLQEETTEEVNEEKVIQLPSKPTSLPIKQLSVPPTPTAPVTEQDSGDWSTVVSKKTKQTLKAKAAKSVLDNEDSTYFFFQDEANSPFIDYVCILHNLNDVCEEAKKYKWSHAYCLDRNMVYDFSDIKHPGRHRNFLPNTAYLHKFEKWYQRFSDTGEAPYDGRFFYVFQEKSTWNEWKFLGEYKGLAAVRKAVKDSKARWCHAYDPQNNDLFNFTQEDYFSQKCTKAPEKYLERFEEFMNTLPEYQQNRMNEDSWD